MEQSTFCMLGRKDTSGTTYSIDTWSGT